jgi:hypothetical protein
MKLDVQRLSRNKNQFLKMIVGKFPPVRDIIEARQYKTRTYKTQSASGPVSVFSVVVKLRSSVKSTEAWWESLKVAGSANPCNWLG